MSAIKTNLELFGIEFQPGAEWDAGYTTSSPEGRWTVIRTDHDFKVVFHYFNTGGKQENELQRFPGTEQGERDAKTAALDFSSRHIIWRERIDR